MNYPHPEWRRHHSLERIGLATSRDLFHWEKHTDNPVVTPGDRAMWGEPKPPGDVKMSAGRDPMIFLDDDLAITKPDYDYSGGYAGLFAKGEADFKEIEWDHLGLGQAHFWGKPSGMADSSRRRTYA